MSGGKHTNQEELTHNNYSDTIDTHMTTTLTWWEQLEKSQDEAIERYGETLKPAPEWVSVLNDGVLIMDPDGWDRSNWEVSWNEPITVKEFFNRRDQSTTQTKITK